MSEVLKSLESLYTQERYAEALELLEKSQELLPAGQFHYNLGTLHLKLEQVGPARHHLEQALHEGFVHSALFNNLNFLQQNLNVIDLSQSTAPWDRFFHYILSVPQDIYLLLFLFFILVTAIALKWVRTNKWLVAGPTLLVALCVSYLYFGVVERRSVAISLTNAQVLEGPSSLYQKKFELPAGSKVLLGKVADDWIYIERPLHFSGWIKKADIGFVGESR